MTEPVSPTRWTVDVEQTCHTRYLVEATTAEQATRIAAVFDAECRITPAGDLIASTSEATAVRPAATTDHTSPVLSDN